MRAILPVVIQSKRLSNIIAYKQLNIKLCVAIGTRNVMMQWHQQTPVTHMAHEKFEP